MKTQPANGRTAPLKIGLVAFGWSGGNFDGERAYHKLTEARAFLSCRGQVVGPDAVIASAREAREAVYLLEQEAIDVLFILQAAFCGAEPLPVLVERLAVPIALWAVREPFNGGRVVANSLCGVQLMASTLAHLGRRYRYFYGDPEEPETAAAVDAFLSAARVVRRLRRLRVGLAGQRAPGFYPLAVDELLLRRQIGPELVHIDLSEVFMGEEPTEAEVQAVQEEFLSLVDNAGQVPPEKLWKVSRSLAVFRRLMRRYDLDCVAIKCWPEFTDGYGVAACSTLSRLGGQGLVAGCEGDINGTITSFILQELAGGEPTFLADLVQVEPGGNTGILWHCGVAPIELAAPGAAVRFGSEFSGVGMNLEFSLKPGRITVARLGMLHGRYRLLVTTGEALPTELLAKGTMALIRFDPPVKQLVDTIINGGWEHHVSMVYGDVADALVELARQLDIECVRL